MQRQGYLSKLKEQFYGEWLLYKELSKEIDPKILLIEHSKNYNYIEAILKNEIEENLRITFAGYSE